MSPLWQRGVRGISSLTGEQIPLFPPFSKGEGYKDGKWREKNLKSAIRKNSVSGSPLWKRGARGDFTKLFVGLVNFFHSFPLVKGEFSLQGEIFGGTARE
jgi:hypothetical protein